MDPPDAWEIERNRRIKEIEGKGNPFIEKWTSEKEAGATQTTSSPKGQSFTCGGKKTCKEMASCDEARFYLEDC